MPLTLLDLSEAKRALRPLAAKRTLTPNNMQAILSGAGNTFGGFGAAKPGRLTADWSRIPRAADQILRIDLRFLRARAREQQINSPIAAKFLQMLRTNLVGPHGIQIAFKVEKQRQRDSNEALDDKTNEELQRAWKKWQRREYCTIHGKYTWKDVCRMASDAIGRDGEFIVKKIYVPKQQNPFGFTLQLIQADQLDDNYNRIGSPKQNQVRLGIEVDRYQKPLFYHLFEGNPYETGMGAANRIPVPADQIYHFFIPRFIGQTRGYPLLAPVMYDMKMLDGYFEAELIAARSGAMMVGAIEQDAPEEFAGDGDMQDGATKLDVENGMFIQLPRGAKLNSVTPEHPTSAFNPFVERSLRLIASGMGVAYHELGNDLAGVNYSSGRLGVLEERDYFMELQNLMIDALCRPVYEDWIKFALLNGAVDLPFDPDRYTDDEAVEFIPRRWPWVDPLKDSQAAIADVQNAFDTHSGILHAHGKDWRKIYKQLAVEQAYADELGIEIGTDIRGDALSEINDGSPEEEGSPGTDSKPAKEEPITPPVKKKPKK